MLLGLLIEWRTRLLIWVMLRRWLMAWRILPIEVVRHLRVFLQGKSASARPPASHSIYRSLSGIVALPIRRSLSLRSQILQYPRHRPVRSSENDAETRPCFYLAVVPDLRRLYILYTSTNYTLVSGLNLAYELMNVE